jgi:hypothetical protein
MKQLLSKNRILRIFLLFIFYFVVILLLWILVKGYYGKFVATVSSYIVSLLQEPDLLGITRAGEHIAAEFGLQRNVLAGMYKFKIAVETSEFAYNVPLTLAIIAISISYIRNLRVYVVAILVLVLVHIFYVYALETIKLRSLLIQNDLSQFSNAGQFLYEMFWIFLKMLVIRFEPFLMGAYLYIYYQKTKGE